MCGLGYHGDAWCSSRTDLRIDCPSVMVLPHVKHRSYVDTEKKSLCIYLHMLQCSVK